MDSCDHSFCPLCLGKLFAGETDRKCPDCHKHDSPQQDKLSSSIERSLQCRRLGLAQWRCDICTVDGNESVVIRWCQTCKELFCADCSPIHISHYEDHGTVSLSDIDDELVLEEIVKDIKTLCYRHYTTPKRHLL